MNEDVSGMEAPVGGLLGSGETSAFKNLESLLDYPDSNFFLPGNDGALINSCGTSETSMCDVTDEESEAGAFAYSICQPPDLLPVGDRIHPLSYRFPSEEEVSSLSTDRARQALCNWYQHFNQLVDYSRTYSGSSDVPQRYKVESYSLGKWVNKQREQKKFLDDGKTSYMTSHKIVALESIGFRWAKPKGQASWDERFEELCQYHEEYGHCNVPTKWTKNSALGRFVSTLRSQYKDWIKGKETQMTRERVELLESIGFSWVLAQRPPCKATKKKCHRRKQLSKHRTVCPIRNNRSTKLKKSTPSSKSIL